MPSEWIEVNIIPSRRIEDLPMDFVESVVFECNTRRFIDSFHFLFEGPEFRFRIKLNSLEHYENAKQLIENRLSELKETNYSFIEDAGLPYNGETGFYGPDGWPIMERSLHMSSVIALEVLKNKDLLGKGNNLNIEDLNERMIHCFLNAQGTTLDTEVVVNVKGACQRLSIIRQMGNNIDSLKKWAVDVLNSI